MSMRLQVHAFAGGHLRQRRAGPGGTRPHSPALDALRSLLSASPHGVGASSPPTKVLAFRRSRPLVRTLEPGGSWRLGWSPPSDFKGFPADSFVYLGSSVRGGEDDDEEALCWAIQLPDEKPASESSNMCFIELRTLMVATDWTDPLAMEELAIAGQARALLEWHNTSRFCGHCGATTAAIDAGRRKQCTNEDCKKKIYPRIDPVVIMLVIDKANNRALLSRQSRFVPRMWSCLAGFIEPGESLEEAVRRETWEETGIEVGEVIYHSSQPWPVGPSNMPCQLMVGFFAYAESFQLCVDKGELEDAQWHSREDVKRALSCAEYLKAQRNAAVKVEHMCKGSEQGQGLQSDFNVESGELAQMFFPGPFAIAHHLISTWAHEGVPEAPTSPTISTSNL